MTPGGVIQRVLTTPVFRTEYLVLDGAEPSWSERRIDALFFATHAEADDFARVLTARLGYPVFAAVATKPMPIRVVPIDTAGHEKVRDLHESPRKQRAQRKQRLAEELRRDDEAELERQEAYA